MEEQLVSFETAKLLKEKGFKELVSHFYLEDGTQLLHTFDMLDDEDSIDIMEGIELENHNHISFANHPHYQNRYSAPTQSLAQKWLREVHKMHIGLDYDDGGWSFFFLTNLNDTKEVNWSKSYKTYEETLEVGLLNALNLITE